MANELEKYNALQAEANERMKQAASVSAHLAGVHSKLEDALQRAKVAQEQYAKAVEAADKALDSQRESLRVAAETAQKELQAVLKNTDAMVKYTSAYKAHSSVVGSAVSSTNKWLGVLGTTTLSFRGLRDQLLKYNQSFYDLSRLQQTGGKGMGNLSKAFDNVKKHTTFSKAAFTEFSNEIGRAYRGLAPTTEFIGNLAVALQQQFGPSVDVAREKAKDLMAIQNKFPALYNRILSVQDKLTKGTISAAEADKMRAGTALSMKAMGMDKNQRQTAMQMMTKTTKKQEEGLALNKEIQKANQSVEDGMLKAAQSMEKAATTMVKAINTVLSSLEKVPLQIMAIVAAMQMLNTGPGIFGGLLKGAGSFGKVAGGLKGTKGMEVAGMGAVAGSAFKGRHAAYLGGEAAEAIDAGTMGKGAMAWKSARTSIRGGSGVMGVLQGGVSGYAKYQEGKEAGDPDAIWKGIKKGATSTIATTAFAAIGTAIAPGIGTAIGGMIGSFIGDKLGDYVAGPVKEAAAKQEDLNAATNLYNDALQKAVDAFEEIESNYKAVYEMAMSNVDALNTQYSIMKEMGILSWDKAIDFSTRTLEQLESAQEAAKGIVQELVSGDMSKVFEGMGIKIDPNLGKEFIKAMDVNAVEAVTGETFNKIVKQFGEGLQKATEKVKLAKMEKTKAAASGDAQAGAAAEQQVEKSLLEQQNIQSAIQQLESNRLTVLKTTEATVKRVSETYNGMAEQARKNNAIYEKRLGLERDVMEAAQFGMGASLQMMQKQVDMAYQMMKIEQDRLAVSDQVVQNQLKAAGMSEQQARAVQSQLKSAKNYMQAQAMIVNIAGKNTQLQGILKDYADAQQDANANILEQQKKIYDLTKEVREGYLDSIREMSTNAGEFEKIIGKQDMGVTQLMDAVNQFTTTGQKNMLNTMKLGGYQTAEQTAAGVGTEVTGRYNAAGGPILSFNQDQRRNERIYGYEKSQQQYFQMQRGGQQGSTVGGGVVLGQQPQYGEALKEESIQQSTKDGSYDGTRQGVIDGLKQAVGYGGGARGMGVMGGLNPAYQNPSSGTFGGYENLGARGPAFGAYVAARVQPQEPLDPRSFAKTPGPMPMPGGYEPMDLISKSNEKLFTLLKKSNLPEKQKEDLSSAFQDVAVNFDSDKLEKMLGQVVRVEKTGWAKELVELKKQRDVIDENFVVRDQGGYVGAGKGGKMTDRAAKALAASAQPQGRVIETADGRYIIGQGLGGMGRAGGQTPYAEGRSEKAQEAINKKFAAPPSLFPKAAPGITPGGESGRDMATTLGAMGIAGLGGQLAGSMAQRSIMGTWASINKGGKIAGGKAAAKITGRSINPALAESLKDTARKAGAERYIGKRFGEEAAGLGRKGKIAKVGKGMLSAKGITGGILGSFLGSDVAQLFGAKKGGMVETAAGIGGGIGGMMAMANPVAMAGLTAYGAGKAIDWGVGKLTGKSLSDRGAQFMTQGPTREETNVGLKAQMMRQKRQKREQAAYEAAREKAEQAAGRRGLTEKEYGELPQDRKTINKEEDLRKQEEIAKEELKMARAKLSAEEQAGPVSGKNLLMGNVAKIFGSSEQDKNQRDLEVKRIQALEAAKENVKKKETELQAVSQARKQGTTSTVGKDINALEDEQTALADEAVKTQKEMNIAQGKLQEMLNKTFRWRDSDKEAALRTQISELEKKQKDIDAKNVENATKMSEAVSRRREEKIAVAEKEGFDPSIGVDAAKKMMEEAQKADAEIAKQLADVNSQLERARDFEVRNPEKDISKFKGELEKQRKELLQKQDDINVEGAKVQYNQSVALKEQQDKRNEAIKTYMDQYEKTLKEESGKTRKRGTGIYKGKEEVVADETGERKSQIAKELAEKKAAAAVEEKFPGMKVGVEDMKAMQAQQLAARPTTYDTKQGKKSREDMSKIVAETFKQQQEIAEKQWKENRDKGKIGSKQEVVAKALEATQKVMEEQTGQKFTTPDVKALVTEGRQRAEGKSTEAQTGEKKTVATKEEKEAEARAQGLRDMIGDVKRGTSEKQIKGMMLSRLSKQGVATEGGKKTVAPWELKPEEYKKLMKDVDRASKMKASDDSKLGGATMDDTSKAGKAYFNSAAQAKGMEASAAAQQQFTERRGQMEEAYGASAEGSGGGGGRVVVTIRLDGNIEGKVEEAYGAMVNLERMAGQKSTT